MSNAHWQLEGGDTKRPPLFAKSFSVQSDFGDESDGTLLGRIGASNELHTDPQTN